MRAHIAACLVITVALLFGLLSLVSHSPAAPRRLTLLVRPHVALAPSDVYVEIRLIPQPSDRALSVTAESDTFSRASAWTLDGEHSQRLFSFWWKQMGAGEYEVAAMIGDGRGHWSSRVVVPLRLIGDDHAF